MFKRFNQHYFDLLWAMTVKEFTVRYKQSTFGFLWNIINPLLQMVIMGTVFSNFVKIPNYFVFLFSGLLPWQFFSLTISKNTLCFISERSLLQKAFFQREIIPLSIVFSNALNLLLSFGLFIAFLQLTTPFVQINFLFLILGIIWLILFTIGFSFFTSSLNVRFRDVSFIVQSLILLWFYATPILYSLTQLPNRLQQLLVINPLAAPLLLIQSSITNQAPPNQTLITGNLITTGIIVFLGVVIYIKESPYFVDWL